VRKAERCDFGGGGDTENREYANAIDHDQLAAAFGEPDVGQRRLTRGKAADMGITVFALRLAFSSTILGASYSCWPVGAHMHYCVCPCPYGSASTSIFLTHSILPGTVVENLAETNDALLSNRRAPDASRKVQNLAGASEGGDTRNIYCVTST
jgi:hypothetical protein